MNAETQAAFSALGLPTTATAEDVAVAYRDLARAWHPDRFPNDPSMKAKAQTMLARINNARDNLKAHFQLMARLNPPRDGRTQSPKTAEKPGADPDRERKLMVMVLITFLIIISACCFGVMFMFVSSPFAMLAATLLCVTSVSALVVFLVNLTESVIN